MNMILNRCIASIILLLVTAAAAGISDAHADSGIWMHGTVTDNLSNPVSDALVRFSTASNSTSVRTGADGGYSLSLSDLITVIGEPSPHTFRLRQNYPNPFNPSTIIGYSLDKPSVVRLDIYDVTGRKVCTPENGPRTAGAHSVMWNGMDSRGRPAGAGVYIYRLEAIGRSETRKMLLLDGEPERGAMPGNTAVMAKPAPSPRTINVRVRIGKDGYEPFESGITLDILETGELARDFTVRKLLPEGITDADMREIVRGTFIIGVIEGMISDAMTVRKGDLGKKNIDPAWIPDNTGVALTLRSMGEIQARADSSGDYMFFFIPGVSFADGKVIIELDYIWAVAKDSPYCYLSGGGVTVEYTKQNGAWSARVVSSWIS